MIKTENELIPLMREKQLMILDIFDNRDSKNTAELTDFERNDTYDSVSKKLIHRLISKGILKAKDTSKCLELDETTIYLPEHGKLLFPSPEDKELDIKKRLEEITADVEQTEQLYLAGVISPLQYDMRNLDCRNRLLSIQIDILRTPILKDDIGEHAFHFTTGND